MVEFTKYQGNGNDFIIINRLIHEISDPIALAKAICHRQYGFGADGLLLLEASNPTSYRMEVINADGSIANMCGNGLRCLAAYIHDEGLLTDEEFFIETRIGKRKVRLLDDRMVQIEFEPARFDAHDLAINSDVNTIIDQPMIVDRRLLTLSVLKVDVLHTVVLVPSIQEIPVDRLGKQISELPLFPNRTNVNFVEVIDPQRIRVRTYERGVGPTFSCGTGVVASSVITYRLGKTKEVLEVETLGGPLTVELTPERLYLTGPVSRIGKGYFEWNFQ